MNLATCLPLIEITTRSPLVATRSVFLSFAFALAMSRLVHATGRFCATLPSTMRATVKWPLSAITA